MVLPFRRSPLPDLPTGDGLRYFFQRLIDRLQVLALRDETAAKTVLAWFVWFLDQNGV